MKKSLGTLLVLLVITIKSFGQDFKEFKVEPPLTHISGSLYNSIKFVDSRVDTSNMGIVQVGLMNANVIVNTKIPLSEQLNDYLTSAIDSSAKDGELLLQLRHILFCETTTMSSETGYCYMKAILYAGKDAQTYKMLSAIDTVILVKSLDVTKKLLASGSSLLTELINNNLKNYPDNDVIYSYHDIVKTDSIEKRQIKLYNTDIFENGLYCSYNSFKNQKPDNQIIVATKKDGTISSVRTTDVNSNLVKVKSDEVYAIVFNGNPYVSTGYGYYPLYKGDDYFYFVGKVKPMTTNNEANVIAAGMMFGLVGGLIASAANSSGPGENYFIIIDHSNGGFIHYKKMPTSTH
ncbi:MAG: hypothetical protein R6X09_02790 [Bacteroidales bacterium]